MSDLLGSPRINMKGIAGRIALVLFAAPVSLYVAGLDSSFECQLHSCLEANHGLGQGPEMLRDVSHRCGAVRDRSM